MTNILKKNLTSIIICSFVIIISLFSIYKICGKVKENEKIDYFITAKKVNTSYLKESTLSLFSDTYKDVNIIYTDESNTYYDSMLQANGIIDADILIVKQSLFSNPASITGFIEFDQDFFINYDIDESSYSYIDINDTHYAIIVKSSIIDIFGPNIAFLDNEETYCICINKSSTKIEDAKKIVANLIK